MHGEGTALHSITEGMFCQWNASARTPQTCFCSCALPSSVMLYTNHSDCSQPLPPFPTNMFLRSPRFIQQRLPCLVEDAEFSLNTEPEGQWHSNAPPAQAAPVETGKAPKGLQQGTMHSNPSSSTAARWRPLVRLRPDRTSRTKPLLLSELSRAATPGAETQQV